MPDVPTFMREEAIARLLSVPKHKLNLEVAFDRFALKDTVALEDFGYHNSSTLNSAGDVIKVRWPATFDVALMKAYFRQEYDRLKMKVRHRFPIFLHPSICTVSQPNVSIEKMLLLLNQVEDYKIIRGYKIGDWWLPVDGHHRILAAYLLNVPLLIDTTMVRWKQ